MWKFTWIKNRFEGYECYLFFPHFICRPLQKSNILLCKKEMWGEQKKQISHYTMHTQIFTMFANISFFAIFYQKYFNSKYNVATTDIPNACRDIIVLYVSNTWISNTWIFNILFCTWRPGPVTRLCDTDSDRSWHG
jgi:hypothetical protein